MDIDSNQDPSVHRLFDFIALNLLIFGIVVVVVWLLIALLAGAVAPDDRPWSFFWCTFLLLGPLGVAVALLAQPRPPEGREGLRPGEYFTE